MASRIVLATAGVGLSLLLLGASIIHGWSHNQRPGDGRTADGEASAPVEDAAFVFDMPTDRPTRAGGEAKSTTASAVAAIEADEARKNVNAEVPAPLSEIPQEQAVGTTNDSATATATATEASVAPATEPATTPVVAEIKPQEDSPVAKPEATSEELASRPTAPAPVEEVAIAVDEAPAGADDAAWQGEPVPAEAIVWSAPEGDDLSGSTKAEAALDRADLELVAWLDEIGDALAVPAEATVTSASANPDTAPDHADLELVAWLDEIGDALAIERETAPAPVSGTEAAVVKGDSSQAVAPNRQEASDLATSGRSEPTVCEETARRETDEDDVAFGAIVEEMAAEFAKDLDASEPIAPETKLEVAQAVSNGEPALVATPSAPAESLWDDEELYPGLAFALNRDGERLGEVSTGPAFELRSASESSENERHASAGGSQLARAVQLTREAVGAWVSLLHGPAVVTISH